MTDFCAWKDRCEGRGYVRGRQDGRAGLAGMMMIIIIISSGTGGLISFSRPLPSLASPRTMMRIVCT